MDELPCTNSFSKSATDIEVRSASEFFSKTRSLCRWGVKQAVEDFIKAHEDEISTPIVDTARMENNDTTPSFPFLKELAAIHR